MHLFWMWSNLSVSELVGGRSIRNAQAVVSSGTGVSILIAGPEGFGQLPLAKEVAAAYLCPQSESGKACCKCAVCGAFARGNSGDFLHVMPVGPSRNIKIDQITPREDKDYFPITEFLRVNPVSALLKVILIEDADRMTLAAANSLLKMLEEPPEWARFILTTAALGKLAPTIRSRCLLISCEQNEVTNSIAAKTLSGGAPEEATRLDSEPFLNFTAPFYEWFQSLDSRSKHDALKISEEFQQFAEIYHECAGLEKNETRIANAATLSILASGLGTKINAGEYRLISVLERVLEAHTAVQANIRFQYVCDSIFVNWNR